MGGAALPLATAFGPMLLQGLMGGGGQQTGVATPPDLMGARSGQINLLQYLLGGPSGGGTGAGGTGAGGQGAPGQPLPGGGGAGAMGGGGGGIFDSVFGQGGGQGGQGGGTGIDPNFLQGNPLDRLQQYFGQLGVPQTDLQRQSAGGISQFLTQQSPESRALETAFPALQEMLTPGTMNPQFDRDIAMANQPGGRFSSGNAIMRGEAFRQLFNMRNQAAGTLGMLSQGAGQADWGRLLGGFGVGGQQAQQSDIQQQRVLQLLGGLLGLRQQMVAGLPITQQPGMGQQLGQFGSGLAALLPFLMGGMGAGGGSPAGQSFNLPGATLPGA